VHTALLQRPRQAKVADPQLAQVVRQQVRPFDVAVEDAHVVQVLEAAQELLHEALDLREGESNVAGLQQARHVVVHEGEDHVDPAIRHIICRRDSNVEEGHHVGVPHQLQQLDLPQRSYREL
jgi:hypothetical protein